MSNKPSTLSQPLLNVTPEDLKRIIRRDYSSCDAAVVQQTLEAYGKESWRREVNRVRLAVLKLGNGHLEHLSSAVRFACIDYRDVLYWAELPRYSAELKLGQADEEKRKALLEEDAKQLREWFEKGLETENEEGRPKE